jgi:hypothetical protein
MARVLLLVDVQNEYFPGGGLELPAMEEASKNIAVLLNHFRDIAAPVLHLQHMSMSAEPGLFEPYSQGWELHEVTAPRPGEATIPKYYPNGFRQTWLLAALQQRCASELVVAGAMTQACIDHRARCHRLWLSLQRRRRCLRCARTRIRWQVRLGGGRAECLPRRAARICHRGLHRRAHRQWRRLARCLIGLCCSEIEVRFSRRPCEGRGPCLSS